MFVFISDEIVTEAEADIIPYASCNNTGPLETREDRQPTGG